MRRHKQPEVPVDTPPVFVYTAHIHLIGGWKLRADPVQGSHHINPIGRRDRNGPTHCTYITITLVSPPK